MFTERDKVSLGRLILHVRHPPRVNLPRGRCRRALVDEGEIGDLIQRLNGCLLKVEWGEVSES